MLKEGAIPCLNLPVKSFESSEAPLRSQSSIEKRNYAAARSYDSTPTVDTLKSFEDLKKDATKSKLKHWVVETSENMVSFKWIQKPFAVPKFELIIDMQMKVKHLKLL